MPKLVSAGTTQSLPTGTAKVLEVDGQRIAIFSSGGKYYAIEDTCPHAGASLAEGRLEDGKVVCPWHDAEFDLGTGAVLAPPACEGVKSYPVKIQGNEVQVEI